MADNEVRSVSATGAEKGVKDTRMDLVPIGPLRALAAHYGAGAKKYDDRNWEKGYEWSKSYAALMRHITAFWGGENVDEEGLSHLAAVAFHTFSLMEFSVTHPEFDDRPGDRAKTEEEREQAAWNDYTTNLGDDTNE